MKYFAYLAVATLSLSGALFGEDDLEKLAPPANAGKWTSLFNGKDLTGWTPKFRGEELGVNYKNTFRVEDGVLKVSYEDYDQWEDNFGHLFFEKEYSHYILRLEYRFVGEQAAKAPAWAWRNNGVMLHGQSAASMKKDQSFPRSIEVQLLGGNGKQDRPTANVCTPETQIVMNGAVKKDHCIESSSETFVGDEWITLELEVLGSTHIIHRINGEVVFEYQYPQLDDGTLLSGGSISLQAESAPTEFRKIEIMELVPPTQAVD